MGHVPVNPANYLPPSAYIGLLPLNSLFRPEEGVFSFRNSSDETNQLQLTTHAAKPLGDPASGGTLHADRHDRAARFETSIADAVINHGGRKTDFHALRHMFITRLSSASVSQRSPRNSHGIRSSRNAEHTAVFADSCHDMPTDDDTVQCDRAGSLAVQSSRLIIG